MNWRKIGSVVVFLLLLAVSIVLAFGWWHKYMRKPKTEAPEDVVPNIDQNDNNNNDTVPSNDTDSNKVGKDAYAGVPATLYGSDLASVVKNLNTGDYIGKITAEKEVNGVPYYEIDGQYLVSAGLVVTR